MNIQSAYDSWSGTYDEDRNLTRDLDASVTREMLGEGRYGTILELGCGTGKNTGHYAHIGERVIAIDFSDGMIGRAKERVDKNNVSFILADLSRPWPIPDTSVDLVAANLVLEHIGNIDFIFSEAGRTLIPGGIFFVCELHPYRQYAGKKASFQQENTSVEIPSFVHHLSDFLSAAERNGLIVKHVKEWWHEHDEKALPRLVSFRFEK